MFPRGMDLSEEQQKQLQQFLRGYVHLFASSFAELPGIRGAEYRLQLREGAQPVTAIPRRYSQQQREAIKQEVEVMLKYNIVSPSTSEWTSSPLLIRKPDGSIRFCIDYRVINDLTPFLPFPLPHPQECFDSLYGAKIFSTLDGASGYWQVMVAEESRKYTAFKTPYGVFYLTGFRFASEMHHLTFVKSCIDC